MTVRYIIFTQISGVQYKCLKFKLKLRKFNNSEEQPISRGVQRGTNRGKYKRNSYEKKLIDDAAENVDEDWKAVAKSQDILYHRYSHSTLTIPRTRTD